MRSNMDKRLRSDYGSVMIELAIVLMLWIAMMVGWWRILSGEDMKQSINAAMLAALNTNDITLYATDALTGATARYDDNNVDSGVLNRVNQLIDDRLGKDSSLTATAAAFKCQVMLGYLIVDIPPKVTKGRANGRHSLIPSTLVGTTPEEQTAVSLLRSKAADYITQMTGELMVPADAMVVYKGDYLFQSPAGTPQIDEIYFNTAPFFAWGCVAKKSFFAINLDFQTSGIFVPSRQL